MSDNQVSDAVLGGAITTHAKIPMPKPTVHAAHPFKNKENHDKLLKYLQERLGLAKARRDADLGRMVAIDKTVSGWIRLDSGDKKRADKNKQDGGQRTTEINLPLTFVHIDDMMTYFAQTFAPNRGMFYQTGKPEEQKDASQIVTVMNNHAIYGGYFREVLQGIYSILKYNSGGFSINWAKESGPKITKDAVTNQDKLDTELVWQGNKLESIDKYNFFADPGVHPTKLHCEGEYAGVAKMRSYYWLHSKALQGNYFNCEEALSQFDGISTCTYYRSPPKEANMEADESAGTDWRTVLSGYEYGGVSGGFELVDFYVKLNPTEFGLIDGNAAQRNARSRYETWRFTLLNDKWIIDATYMNNVHGYLPYFLGVLNDDSMGTSQKSTAEILAPLQAFASSLLNTHVKSSRKNLWGLTVYDPTMVDLKLIPEGEVSARIPMKPESYGRDVRTGIWEHGGKQDTSQTMEDLDSVMNIIDKFFPTQSMPSQIASIDRAVDSQVAAVQQGVNRRQQKAARLLDDVLFRNVRFAMYYNIIQYQPDNTDVTDYYTGENVQIDIASLRQTDLPFIIGQGLKAIDRQQAAKNLQQIIFALIQAPKAAERIDILGMIDYWTSMIDIDIDMKQFEIQAPVAAAPQVDENGNPIQPATAPASVTQPIYGKSPT